MYYQYIPPVQSVLHLSDHIKTTLNFFLTSIKSHSYNLWGSGKEHLYLLNDIPWEDERDRYLITGKTIFTGVIQQQVSKTCTPQGVLIKGDNLIMLLI